MIDLDSLDLRLLHIMREAPGIGTMEIARRAQVARATATARVARMEGAGVISNYGPNLDLAAAGYGVQAFVTLEILQGRLSEVTDDLAAIPGILEAYATTGPGDVMCRVAAASNDHLQSTLLAIDRSSWVRRSTSVVILSELIAFRALNLLDATPSTKSARAPAYRDVEPRKRR